MNEKYRFLASCVGWPAEDVDDGLIPMIESGVDVEPATFFKYVDKSEAVEMFGYERDKRHGLTITDDFAIRFKRGVLYGNRVYFIVHSRIEYVWVHPDYRKLTLNF